MTLPRWKRLLSHLVEIKIESGESPLNPDLLLSLKKGRYCLSTPNAIYSFADLYDNFYKTFELTGIVKQDNLDVLLLGFGMGSIPYMLEKKFEKYNQYVGVEADETIAYWASLYVLPELKSQVEVHTVDAEIFVETCERQFDLIAMDIFIDNKVPEQFEDTDFLKALRRILRPDGMLLYNRLALRSTDRKHTQAFFRQTFKNVFPEATYLDLAGNWMLVNRAV